MATIDELKKRWQPMLRYTDELRKAQTLVLAETGVWVPLIRLLSHMGIETGYTGNKNLVSKTVNECCDRFGKQFVRGVNCSKDCRAHGLFQIYWPPFLGVDWTKIYNAEYNCYLGAKTLAYRFKECGNWRGASIAFFSGSCTFTGTTDPGTGTDDRIYDQAMSDNMAELERLDLTDVVSDPKGPATDGSKNTPIDNSCLSLPIEIGGRKPVFCPPNIGNIIADPSVVISELVDRYMPRIVMVIIGIILLGIGVWAVL